MKKGITGRLSGNQLKMIAAVSMFADHAAYVLPFLWTANQETKVFSAGESILWCYWLIRAFGRIAFPVFAFLLVEGAFHTRDWRRYALRLGLFAAGAEFPFDLMHVSAIGFVPFSSDILMRYQNVLITLLLGLLMVRMLMWSEKQLINDPKVYDLCRFVIVGGCCAAAFLLRCDYDCIGIILITIIYYFRLKPQRMCLYGWLWMSVVCGGMIHLSYIAGYAAAFFLILCYDGTRGRKASSYVFYWFYPVHMLVLAGAAAAFRP